MAAVAALLSSFLLAVAGAIPAAADPVSEIEGVWIDPPETIARGNPVVAEWRVNLNDDAEPPSNDPVDNVVATFTLGNAFFDGIPDLCLTEGVDPVSALNAEATELTCNFGTVAMGTALVVLTPVVANGVTGSQVTHSGTGPDGQTVDLPPIDILNPFIMDIQWGGVTEYYSWDDLNDPSYVDVDFEWSVRMGSGSDPGPDSVTYRLTMATQDGSPVQVGTHPPDLGQEANWGVQGCTPYDFAGASGAAGHPFSSVPENIRHTNFVDSCTLTPVPGQPGVFDLTLEGINYDLTNVAEQDSQGNPLPEEWDYVASGSVWFRVITDAPGSISLSSSAPTYTAPTGQQFADPAGNNTSSKVYVLPGGWSAGWRRGFTQSGGTQWDDSYRVPAGTTLVGFANNSGGGIAAEPDSNWGNCLVFDPAFVTYLGDQSDPEDNPAWSAEVVKYQLDPARTRFEGALDNPPAIEYHTGSVGNGTSFDCGSGTWTTTAPADLSTVTAIRILYPHSLYSAEGVNGFSLVAWLQVNDDVPSGQDVWVFGSALRNGTWFGPPQDANVLTPTPDARYPHTNGRRDIVRIVLANPVIQKSTPNATITPGVPVDYTLTYSATGTGLVPPTVDGYVITDTLPVGMTYESGSADPEPVVSVNGSGQQVLTWTLNGVETMTQHTLTYQAVADTSVAPGTELTNTAVASLGGQNSRPATETVTTTTNGYTFILKMSDVEYIPNRLGDGVGSGSWTVTIESRDPITQAFTDTIDILPYNGDDRGTSFSGTYTLDDVVLPDGGTVYYTDADPATLSDDPADASNGAAGDPTGNTVGWTTERPDNPTAVRVIGGELVSGGSFSFQVVITTDGAQPQDVYVNRAQARAEHTALVMRTSAALVVTDFITEKSSDPEDGSTVKPGDTVTYTVTVTQVGDVPAGGVFTDDMSDVLDDADYNDDVEADIGTATFTDGVLSWEGDIPVGEVATITYSVTVKPAAELDAGDGNTFLANQVSSPGCVDEESCNTEHPVGYYTMSKTADPAPGATVGIGDVVTYHVQVVQKGEGAVTNAFVDDDLTAVLDDATWNDDAEASSGEVAYTEPTLSWSGPLAVGEVVDITYSVTVVKGGDSQLENVVTSVCPEDEPDCLEAVCVPAPDENPDCITTHTIGDFEVMKVSDPESGSQVEVGDVVTYTVTVTHVGVADVAGEFTDDLSAVLDDATYNGDVAASAGQAAVDGDTLTWSGDLVEGDVVTVTYSVTVTAEGDRHLQNVVTTPGDCVPAEGQDEACTTEHLNGAYTFSKTSDPAPGSGVAPGDVITYTVTVQQVGSAPVADAWVTDDMSAVADDATYNGDAKASSGEVSRDGTTLRWDGDLEVGQEVTITYSVTVTDEGDNQLRNVVTSGDERAVCVAAADGNADCQTAHQKDQLPDTGAQGLTVALLGGLALLAGGLALALRRRTLGPAAPGAMS